MTTPDHRPYLLPTDLRTAEDVAEWLRDWRSTATDAELIAVVDWIHAYDVQDLRGTHDLAPELACLALRARLDRERRQACRRGAAYHWRAACRIMRASKDRRGRRRDKEIAAAVWAGDHSAHPLLAHLAAALAFRAAARAK